MKRNENENNLKENKEIEEKEEKEEIKENKNHLNVKESSRSISQEYSKGSRRLSKEETKPEDIRELTIKNLDTGEKFIIGENDPDFEFDTFPLSPSSPSTDGREGRSYHNNNNHHHNKSWYKSFIDWLFGKSDERSQNNNNSNNNNQSNNQTRPQQLQQQLQQEQKQQMNSENEQHPSQFTKLSSFKFRRELGRGAFGRVLLAESKINGELYALKIISKKNMRLIDKRQAMAERDILHAMAHNSPHPFTTGLKFAFQSENNLYLGMEYFCGGNLKQLIQKFGTLPEEWVKIYAAELILAVSHLHSMQVLYRDIKPHNVMIDGEGHIILIDYGLSKQEVNNPTGAMSLVGTPDYSAPEVLRTAVFRLENEDRKRKGKTPKVPQVEKGEYGYGMAADWWSIGVMIYEMLCGYPTFRGADLKQTYQKVLYGDVQFTDESYFSPSSRELILGLLQRDPQQRLGSAINSPQDIQQSSFFENINWDDIYNRVHPGPWIPPSEKTGKTPKKESQPITSIIDQTQSDTEEDIPGFSGQNCSETTSEISEVISVRDSIIATGENRNDPNRLPHWSFMDENTLKIVRPPTSQFK